MLAFDAAEGHRHTPTNGPRGAAGGAVAGAMVSEADTAALHALAAAVVRRRDFATAAQRQRWLGRLPKKLKACMRAARSRAEWDAAPNAFEGDAGEGQPGAVWGRRRVGSRSHAARGPRVWKSACARQRSGRGPRGMLTPPRRRGYVEFPLLPPPAAGKE